MITITKTRITAIGLAALASTAIAVPVADSGGDQGVSRQARAAQAATGSCRPAPRLWPGDGIRG